MFFHEINFVYLIGGSEASKWIYLLAGIGIPLGVIRIHQMLVRCNVILHKSENKSENKI